MCLHKNQTQEDRSVLLTPSQDHFDALIGVSRKSRSLYGISTIRSLKLKETMDFWRHFVASFREPHANYDSPRHDHHHHYIIKLSCHQHERTLRTVHCRQFVCEWPHVAFCGCTSWFTFQFFAIFQIKQTKNAIKAMNFSLERSFIFHDNFSTSRYFFFSTLAMHNAHHHAHAVGGWQ